MAIAQIKSDNTALSSVPYQSASLDIWDKKYRLKDKHGRPIDDSLEQTYQRIAKALADIEQNPEQREHWQAQFLWALQHGAIPAGRIISNAGAR